MVRAEKKIASTQARSIRNEVLSIYDYKIGQLFIPYPVEATFIASEASYRADSHYRYHLTLRMQEKHRYLIRRVDKRQIL
jgi:hypothetical protein